ncbi:DNA alkylation repair protein [Trichocoleus sp. FACHB-90]|uniref:DNA alkylation repair protein n=1 Tax=Cyanophyceae TaxID=3028117 RepID=UPI0016865D8A|nr:DNA alkylation repair protein [Trichocoleus sp. FACHB-90]MBD1929965.1 DNA alkylation repair protein [Trichocoleus sp. FACHB-90]
MASRKGAKRPVDVPVEVLQQLNSGEIEAVNLSECLAVDFVTLMGHVVPELTSAAKSRIQPSNGITKRMLVAGELLLEHLGAEGFQRLASHPSDTVRGWAAYMVATIPDMTLIQRLDMIRPLAADNHFGVREWAWLALRSHIATQIRDAIRVMTVWLGESSPNLRRFAIESTRPRGVWCCHIQELKDNPEIGLPLLEPVRADASTYVQDSVANWLNDAAKSRPDWVQIICRRWQLESDTPETTRICTRALRSLRDSK